jgi:ketosteroid isomerase-like protein
MKRHVQGILVLGLVASCGGAATSAWKQPPNALAIEREAVTWVERWHERLAGSDRQAWGEGFALDGLLVGPGPSDAVVGPYGRKAARSFAGAVTLVSIALETGLASDGRSFWLADELDRRDEEGAPGGRLRATILLEQASGGWQVLLAHYGAILTDEAARELAGDPGAQVVEIVDGVPEHARRLAEIMSASLASPDVFTAALSQRPGTMAFGPGPEDRFQGAHAVSEWLRAIYARPGARIVRSGGLRADVCTGGRLGYVATDVDLVTKRDGLERSRRSRLTAIFAREGKGWAIVQLHLSHPFQVEE